eukprot:7228722-Ditylum_brightwellii.AAC.1
MRLTLSSIENMFKPIDEEDLTMKHRRKETANYTISYCGRSNRNNQLHSRKFHKKPPNNPCKSDKKPDFSKVQCFKCGKLGHYANKNNADKHGPKPKNNNFESAHHTSDKPDNQEYIAMATETHMSQKASFKHFLADSGATSHFTPYLTDLQNINSTCLSLFLPRDVCCDLCQPKHDAAVGLARKRCKKPKPCRQIH